MANASFTRKTIRFEITMGKGSFSEGGNQKTIEGLACDVTVQKPGLPEKNSASVKIWGMKYEDMASLTMLAFKPLESQHNTIAIYAGDLGGTLSMVFSGEITSAYADFNSAPDVAMQFEADTGSYPQQKASKTVTTDGETQADKLFQQFCKDAGYAYKNEGVTSSVKDSWFPGSPIAKIQKLARDIDCDLIIDDQTVIVMPSGQAREGNAVLLNKDSGLIGYPTFNQDGIQAKAIYNPSLEYGGVVKIESIVPRATGEWKITKLSHHLVAYVHGSGAWETDIEAAYNDGSSSSSSSKGGGSSASAAGGSSGSDENTVKGTRKLTTANTQANAADFMIEEKVKSMVSTADLVSVGSADQNGHGSAAGYGSATPCVCQMDAYNNVLEPAKLSSLKYFRYQGGKGAFIVDPQPGDKCVAVCMKRDSTQVKTGQSDPVQPGTHRSFDQADAVLFNSVVGAAPEYWVEIEPAGNINVSTSTAKITMEVRSAGDIDIKTASGKITMTATEKIRLDAPLIEITGPIVQTGEQGTGQSTYLGGFTNIGGTITSNGIVLETHTHTGVQTGGGFTGEPQ